MAVTDRMAADSVRSATARIVGERSAVLQALMDVDTIIASVPGLTTAPGQDDDRDARLTLQSMTPEAVAAGTAIVSHHGILHVIRADSDEDRISFELVGHNDAGGDDAPPILSLQLEAGGSSNGVTPQGTDGLAPVTEVVVSAIAPTAASGGKRLAEQLASNLEATLAASAAQPSRDRIAPVTADLNAVGRVAKDVDRTPTTSPDSPAPSAEHRLTWALAGIAAVAAVGLLIRLLRPTRRPRS